MSRILFSLLLMVALVVPAHAASKSGSSLLLHSLLTSENRNFVLMGAKEVFRNPDGDPAAVEIVAELLCERTAAHVGDALDLDTTAWLIKGLGASKSNRYREVIEKAVAAYANPKVSVWANAALPS